ncbi:glutamine ABC transporter ATP-binding protein [Candidatus Geothermarchaeota archaeon ex4572_27]|nr:MAG: glutamine ABC transporter ATP-binding protein [Candidatus Geothermarchaeota archaeon ex4572_27]
MEDATPVLACRGLKKRYGGLEVLKGVDLSISRGEIKVIIGPSGSGKSTLLRLLGLLEEPDEGRIFFRGVDVYSSNLNLNKLRAKIGFVFQQPSLFHHLTALKNVMLGLRYVLGMSEEEARRKAMETLRLVHMERWANYYPAQLSGGQQQRVAIARALAMDPEIILFDEPTASLDIELTWEVIDVMRELAERGTTMLVVTHEIGFAKEVADEILFMDGGRIIESGPPELLLRRPRTERARRFLSRLLGET